MSDKRKKIWIALACKNLPTTTKCLESALHQASIHGDSDLAFLLVDKSEGSELSKWALSSLSGFETILIDKKELEAIDKENIREYRIVNYDNRLESEQQDRMQVSFACKKYAEQIGDSIIWHIGERLSFSEAALVDGRVGKRSRRNFFKEVRDFHSKYPDVDVALGRVGFAAPLPVMLTLEKQMGDLLKPGSSNDSPVNSLSNCHDLYDNEGRPAISLSGLRDFSYILGLCLRGIPVTRPVLPKAEDAVKRGPIDNLLGGDHIIVFNKDLHHSIPFFALRFRGRISRRTGMIQGWLMQKAGHTVKGIELSLFHHRNLPGVDFEEIRAEYMADILGALTTHYLQGTKELAPRLEQHRQHLLRLKEYVSEAQHLYENSLLYSLDHVISQCSLELVNWTEESLLELIERLEQSMTRWVEKSKEPPVEKKKGQKPVSRTPDWLDFGNRNS